MVRYLALLVALAPSPLAGAFHDTLTCGACHNVRGPDGPEQLVGRDETTLCLRCHDGRTDAPDVLHEDPRGLERAGGALNRVGDTTVRRVHGEDTGHTLGSTEPPPGFDRTWTQALTCKSCHAVHRNGRYRNLGPDPFLRSPAYLAAAAVFERAELPPAAPGRFSRDGDLDSSSGPSSRSAASGLDRFCAACHPLFHGAENTQDVRGGGFIRHPTGGIPIGGAVRQDLQRAAQTPRLSWLDAETPEVSCLTCHRAHGTRHRYGLIWWDRDAPSNGEDGAGRSEESLCLTCHRLDETPLEPGGGPPLVRRVLGTR